MKVAVLSSGGKDSSYAAWWCELQGWEVTCIVTVVVTGGDSLMFQLENTPVAALQASSMGVPWLPVRTEGEEGAEINDLQTALSGIISPHEVLESIWPSGFLKPDGLEIHTGVLEIDALVSGALRSDFQKTRLEMMCERLGVKSFSPLWHKGSRQHMSSLIDHGFGVVITSVSSEGLTEEWLGRKLDNSTLERLQSLSEKYRFNLDGEGGEFETMVVSGPHMEGHIVFQHDVLWNGSRGSIKLDSCSLHQYR